MNIRADWLIGLLREGPIGFRSAGIAFVVSAVLMGSAHAAGPDFCAALPLSKVVEITHQKLDGVRSDSSEEAHSYGCSYGGTAHVSVSVIRPGGGQAFARTQSRLSHATAVTGVGDRGVFTKEFGVIVLFGDTAIGRIRAAGLDERRRDFADREISSVRSARQTAAISAA
jgi:hypothetical protein